ncbi:MAG: phosphopantetheine-binding protein [Thiohalospira sp.]|uniref:phosphopantetheine-binding protein n=1 Tax=Thiohalospira sp. TaxID=3080549 RepID=UPI00397FD963
MMATQDPEALKQELKAMVVTECDKAVEPESIDDDEPLFGSQTRLQLDSIDALQLSMALQKRFGIRLTDSKELRQAFSSVAILVDYIQRQS